MADCLVVGRLAPPMGRVSASKCTILVATLLEKGLVAALAGVRPCGNSLLPATAPLCELAEKATWKIRLFKQVHPAPR